MISTAELVTDQGIAKTCKDCGKGFEVPNAPLIRALLYCPTCSDRRKRDRDEQDRDRRAREREEAWQELCPPLYRETDQSKLPRPDLLREVLAWEFGPRGLLLHGETGLGKSRCAWMLLRREFDARRRIAVLDSTAAFRYTAMFARNCTEAEDWIDTTAGKDLVFLDDVFKCRFSDSFEQALFALIEVRTNHLRPLIATCNDTGESLRQRLSQDRGDALLRRLREFCQSVAFTR